MGVEELRGINSSRGGSPSAGEAGGVGRRAEFPAEDVMEMGRWGSQGAGCWGRWSSGREKQENKVVSIVCARDLTGSLQGADCERREIWRRKGNLQKESWLK